MTASPVPDALLAEAAGWMARLHEAPEDPDSLQALSRWIARSPAHAQAWARAERVLGAFGQVPPPMRAQALRGLAKPDRRRLAARLLGLGVAAPVVYVGWRAMQADLQSGTGQIRQATLDDGTRMTLDTGTQVDIRYSAAQRVLSLRAGRIFVVTAPDSALPARPFLISTPVGTVQAIGTQFTVSLEDDGARVDVYEGAVLLRPAGKNAGRPDGDGHLVRAGRQARFDAATAYADTDLAEPAPAWTRGVLTADNMRLADWTRALARYRPGILHCDSAVADLRVYGSFSLRDTDASLALLARTLPVSVATRTRYWVRIQPRGA
ncbi:FecR domain-containing protein [Achromobacter piechaudii]|uniref:FecR domain-containing protein n=1 Tax=Achromobacter piechaudii TaxID=72556 RepID=UPI003DA95E7A